MPSLKNIFYAAIANLGYVILIACLLLVLISSRVLAQAPNISYPTPQTYNVGTPIKPLEPTNTGGAVPSTIYGEIIGLWGTGSGAGGEITHIYVPTSIAIDAGSEIYISTLGSSKIRKITWDGLKDFADGISSTGIALGPDGNLYVSEQIEHLIKKITPAGAISTLAGQTGIAGSADGQGSAASFKHPGGLAIDAAGNVYVADQGNNMIRKITPTGMVTTYAGSGATGNADGPVSIASFSNPAGVTLDATGNLYVADAGNNAIRKITPAGMVSTVTTGLSYPRGVAIDPTGYIYVSNQNNTINVISPAGIISTINITSAFSTITLKDPTGLLLDGKGYLLIADSGNNQVEVMLLTGYIIDKPLPAGLVFDRMTGIISGTPTVGSPPTNYTITGFNARGGSSSTVKIQVLGPLSQSIITFPSQSGMVLDINGYLDPKATSTNNETPIIYKTSSNPAVAIIENNLVKIVGLGVTVITATQAGNANYLPATPATTTITVKQGQTITFPPINNKLTCDPDFAANVASDFNEIPVTYTSSNTSVATVNVKGIIHIVGLGVTTITASQVGNDKYIAAAPVSQQLEVIAGCITITNTFTPNGDGINDIWKIPDLVDYPDCQMRIFNRNGQLVFQSRGYTKAWDGTYNGQQLPYATYYYVLSLDGGSSTKKLSGSVTIVR